MNRITPAISVLLLAACGSDSTSSIRVHVSYPPDADATEVAAIHAWVVKGTDEVPVSCNLLVAGVQEPYDIGTEVLGEGGVRSASEDELTVTVRAMEGLVFVMAIDYAGEGLWAGCAEAEGTAEVTLEPMFVYDCADDTTPQGGPCDDGNPCTAGEACRSGSCTGGTARTCAELVDACNDGVCDPSVGCQKVPANDGATCDLGGFCSEARECANGACVGGTPNPAPPAPGPCYYDASAAEDKRPICDDGLERWLFLPKPYGTPCSDGNDCTTGDACNGSGTCTNTGFASNVTACSNPCKTGGTCSGIDGTCTAGSNTTSACDDGNPCTLGDTCTAGTCVAGASYAATGTLCNNTTTYGGCYLTDTCTGFSASCQTTEFDADYDGDGFYRRGCPWNGVNDDCDDTEVGTYPGATEVCDSADNDCDGVADDSCI